MPCENPSEFATDAELLLQYPAFADTEWLVTVTDSADGTYSVTVLGVTYDRVAAGETIEEVRDGLVVSLSAGGGAVPVAESTNQIVIVGEVPGLSLGVETSPSTLYATDTFTPEIRECALESTKRWFCTSRWGNKLCQGHIYAAAHWLKKWYESHSEPGATSTGPTVSMTQGPFSQSWAANTGATQGSDGWWASTPEGAAYLALRDSLGPTVLGMRMGGCRRRYGGARWQ